MFNSWINVVSYIHGLVLVSISNKNGQYHLCADETQLYYNFSSLLINPAKSMLLLFGKDHVKNLRSKIIDRLDVKIDNIKLECCESARNLRVIIIL